MSESGKTLIEVSNPNKIIYFIDEEVPLLRKYGQIIAHEYPDYEIVAMVNLTDAKKQIGEKKPQILITSLNFSNNTDCFEFIEFLKSSEITRDIQVIVTGTRAELEEKAERISYFDMEILPKSITTPHLMNVLSMAIQRANSVQADIKVISEGDHLFKEGDESDSIYILKSGELQVYTQKGDQFVELAIINQQQMIGEMALIDRSLRSASIRAIRDTEVLELKLGKVDQYIEEQPFWMKMLVRTLADRLREANKKLLSK
jgi:DNA-binding NarL/FixJ family response regulator